MKKIMLLSLIILINCTAIAQKRKTEIGFFGGLNSSKFYNNIESNVQTFYSPVSNPYLNFKSYATGLTLDHSINHFFSLRSDIIYETKGSGVNLLSSSGQTQIEELSLIYKLKYTTIILLSKVTFGEKFKYYIEAGPYVGYLINAVRSHKFLINGQLQETFNTSINSAFKKLNLGATLGVGVSYPLSERMNFNFTVRRSKGLNSIDKSQSKWLESNINSFSVLGGINFKIHRK